jgi:HSP20 family protein
MNNNKELITRYSAWNNSLEDLLQSQKVVSPSVDILESDDHFTLIADLPGLRREDLLVKVEENNLVIFGKVDYDSMISRKYVLQENEIGNYHRVFKISDTIEKNKVTAKYDNGQLVVILPKNESTKTRTIEID